MKKIEFNELIEKVFSMGYECALEEQKEFGNKENKKKRREWEIKQGRDAIFDDKVNFYDGLSIGENRGRAKKTSDWDSLEVAAARAARKKEEESGLNDMINRRGTAEKNRFYRNSEKQRYVGKDRNDRFDNYIKDINNLKLSKVKEEKQEQARQKFKEEAKSRLKNIKNIRVNRNLKKAGMVAGGVALAAGAAYGIKKHRDMVRARKAERQRLEEENKSLKEQLANKK